MNANFRTTIEEHVLSNGSHPFIDKGYGYRVVRATDHKVIAQHAEYKDAKAHVAQIEAMRKKIKDGYARRSAEIHAVLEENHKRALWNLDHPELPKLEMLKVPEKLHLRMPAHVYISALNTPLVFEPMTNLLNTAG